MRGVKACIVTHDEYPNIPYVKTYERLLAQQGIPFDIILWNRSGEANAGSPAASQNHTFDSAAQRGLPSKIKSRLQWKYFARAIVRGRAYDFLIVCTTVPAVLLARTLLQEYGNRYLLDIRDFTFESIPPYKQIVRRLIEKSGMTTISSKGFLAWMPKTTAAQVLTHNIGNAGFMEQRPPDLPGKTTVVIGFVGGIRYFDTNKRLICSLANSSKYALRYVGRQHPGCYLPEYCKQQKIRNVTFEPRYDNGQKPEIYKNIDMINCVYGSASPETCTALPNKLYDCLLFKKPMIVSSGTYLSELVNRYHLGVSIRMSSDSVPQKLSEYIDAFDPKIFLTGCDTLLSEVLNEQEGAERAIASFIKKIAAEVQIGQA
jgi:hypothetical protein